ncbi:hypothetical protein J5X84_19760 [Streptosporangiaceae bacterium NEAU-GS5]|nr:hypothetical protein [Streptosporangiaceae bacterium NEAU-GS5]
MVKAVSRLADNLLARVAPKAQASAGCTYQWYLCYCSGGLRYSQKCMFGCPQVPNHCYPCDTITGTC